jgi:hypothetical protein
MFPIIWTPSGFYVVDRPLNDTKMNNNYFVTNLFIPVKQIIFSRGRVPHQNKFVIHLNNCSVHTTRTSTDWLEEYGIRRRSHPLTLSA